MVLNLNKLLLLAAFILEVVAIFILAVVGFGVPALLFVAAGLAAYFLDLVLASP